MGKPKRISVSINDDLYKRLQEAKEEFNVSLECRRAIENKLSFQGRIQEERERHQEVVERHHEDLEDIMKRLRKEKELHYKLYHKEQGCANGYKDAHRMKYEELAELTGDEPYQSQAWASWCGDYSKELRELIDGDSKFNPDIYLEGWLEGVQKFWEEIKDKL